MPIRFEMISSMTSFAPPPMEHKDRKSTRLNSSHITRSYAVFCLKKKRTENPQVGQEKQRPVMKNEQQPNLNLHIQTTVRYV